MAKLKARVSMSLSVSRAEREELRCGLESLSGDGVRFNHPDAYNIREGLKKAFQDMDRFEDIVDRELSMINNPPMTASVSK